MKAVEAIRLPDHCVEVALRGAGVGVAAVVTALMVQWGAGAAQRRWPEHYYTLAFGATLVGATAVVALGWVLGGVLRIPQPPAFSAIAPVCALVAMGAVFRSALVSGDRAVHLGGGVGVAVVAYAVTGALRVPGIPRAARMAGVAALGVAVVYIANGYVGVF
jgi:hypothetical protein